MKHRLSGPLLSRFDLLFILLDKPNEELDYKLSSHIISLHSKYKKYFKINTYHLFLYFKIKDN